MGALRGRVILVTGAGRGLGRAHAFECTGEGARVIVNDLGSAGDGDGADSSPADEVVKEIVSAGGIATADHGDVSDWNGAEKIVDRAVESFGRLDVLVNNAGILRDSFITKLSERDWDAVIRVHLKGHFSMLRAAALHWRARSKAGEKVDGAVINTASPSGVTQYSPGQANYGAAKAGIVAMTMVAAAELGRIGVTANAIAPRARTRLTEQTPDLEEMISPPSDPGAYDAWDPATHAPLIAYLATAGCTVTGQVFEFGRLGELNLLEGWRASRTLLPGDGPPTRERLVEALGTGESILEVAK